MRKHLYFSSFMTMAFMVITTVLRITFAIAEQPQYTITDMREQVKDGWYKNYKAYGRDINIDLDIQVPVVEKVPVLKVKRYPAISEPRFGVLSKRFVAPPGDTQNYYAFESRMSDMVTAFAYKYPFIEDESKGESVENITWPRRSLITFDWDKAYADNNPLKVKESFNIAVKLCNEIFQEDLDLKIQAVGLEDRFINKTTGVPIREKGAYHFRLRQSFHGIPVMCNAKNAFWTRFFDTKVEDYNDFVVMASIVDSDSYYIYCALLKEEAIVYEDIPFNSFEKAKTSIEELITNGYIRQIYSLQLAYVLYNDPSSPDSFYLVPSWVAWCEMYSSPRETANIFDSKEMYFDTSNYHPVIINAQTGEALDSLSEEKNRSYCPPIILWENVQ